MNLSKKEQNFLKMVRKEHNELGIPKNHPDNDLGNMKKEMKELVALGNSLVKKGKCHIIQDDRRMRSFSIV